MSQETKDQYHNLPLVQQLCIIKQMKNNLAIHNAKAATSNKHSTAIHKYRSQYLEELCKKL
ncbi:hypothetical protein QKQ25_gp013 [Hyphantria cunea granulovirus]|uniref:Uncharacterized protein n=1 Tax=Hyphantria cunea granulovirus TaxID=307448 RepID=A0AAF1D251_9BBAC|nr:hypothetical protein QKQ25_gp013 [Hyphantria cunea granulovirus]QBQ01566.1 hypothetical protein HycuGV_00013 [Hyphantria cunea granulovirus]